MPYIQTLPYVPSFGERLAGALSEATTELAKGYQERAANRRDEALLPRIFQEDLTPMERISLAAQLSPKRQDSLYKLLGSSQAGEKFAFQQEREGRLKSKDLSEAYNQRLKQISSDLKDAHKKDEIINLKKQKADLEKEHALNRTRLRSGKEPVFKLLEMQGEEAAPMQAQGQELPPQAQMGAAHSMQRQAIPQAQPLMAQAAPGKAKFDPRNPQHAAIREKALQLSGGDRIKANAILEREFVQ